MSRSVPETGGFKALRSFGVTLQLKTVQAEETDCDSRCVYEGRWTFVGSEVKGM